MSDLIEKPVCQSCQQEFGIATTQEGLAAIKQSIIEHLIANPGHEVVVHYVLAPD